MTLDEVIEKLIEAKEHCVQGNSEVKVHYSLYNMVISNIVFDSKQVYIEI